jgi:glycosyltransferase involved in cell wall biosynthesis
MFLSIIVPIFNEKENLQRLLPTLLKQKFDDFEIILVDDPKTDDGTEEYVNSLKSSKINYFMHSPGLRVPAKRNEGARISRGRYLYFIDADMEFPDEVLSEIHTTLKKSGARIVFVPERTPGSQLINRLKDFEKQLGAKNADLSAARVFERNLFEKLDGYNQELDNGEDLEFSDRAIKAGARFVFADCEVNHYETSGDSLVGYLKTKWNYGKKSAKYLDSDRGNVVSKGTISRLGYFKSKKLYQNPLTGIMFLVFKTSELMLVSLSFFLSKLK